MRVKVTDYKTKRINRLTGGKIGDFQIPDYPGDEGMLSNSFMTKDGVYIDAYDRAWWYVKHNLKICNDHPCGVAESYKDNLHVGYVGYTHRGSQRFTIGNRIFDENYVPKQGDYSKQEWSNFIIAHESSIKREVKDGYVKTENEARENIPISDVIPFVMRGNKRIETVEESKKAAISMANYLS